MEKLLEQHFVKTYPKIFKDMYGDPKKTCLAFGIECGSGWFFLLDNLCAQIQSRIDNRSKEIKKKYAAEGDKKIPQVVALQVKEKFGQLRYYYKGGDEYIKALVDIAEYLSFSICENCGIMNQSVGRTKGWIQSLCPTCALEFGKDIVQNKKMVALWDKVVKSRAKPMRSWQTVGEWAKGIQETSERKE